MQTCYFNKTHRPTAHQRESVLAIRDGFLHGKRYLIMDRDSKFCKSFRGTLQCEGVKSLLLPPRSPNLNAHLERFFGSLKREALDRMILFGEKSLAQRLRVRDIAVEFCAPIPSTSTQAADEYAPDR